VPDLTLDKVMLQDVAKKNVWSAPDLRLGGHPKPAINRHLKTGN
jgi:hypothetical protein